MRSIDKKALRLAHCLAMCNVYYKRKDKRAEHKYWKEQVARARAEYNLALKELDGKELHPEQKPLFTDDIPF